MAEWIKYLLHSVFRTISRSRQSKKQNKEGKKTSCATQTFGRNLYNKIQQQEQIFHLEKQIIIIESIT